MPIYLGLRTVSDVTGRPKPEGNVPPAVGSVRAPELNGAARLSGIANLRKRTVSDITECALHKLGQPVTSPTV